VNEKEEEEEKKERVKGVFNRAGLVGWTMTTIMCLGLLATEPILPVALGMFV
jgi:hypothetical protein